MVSKPWIAWCNYMDLSTVRSLRQSTTVRLVIGAMIFACLGGLVRIRFSIIQDVPDDAFMKFNHADDLQLLSPSQSPLTLPSSQSPLALPSMQSPQDIHAAQPQIAPKEKFLVPVLSNYLGANNQLMEYMSAAVIARATGRTLCLQPLFRGPLKHEGRTSIKNREGTISMENQFDTEELSKFVRVASMSRCKAIEFGWSFVKWRSTADIARDMGGMDSDCAAISGLFPGNGWRGAFLAVSAYLNPSSCIADAVSGLQVLAFGSLHNPFLAIHWRFEESNCKGHDLGLCFVRCGDGSIVSSGLHSVAMLDWSKKARHCSSLIRGVLVRKQDMISAILEKVREQNVSNVYLATDGWIRGSHEQMLVAEVVRTLRAKGLNVAGLWKIRGVPNFSDGGYFNPLTAVTELGLVNSCKAKPHFLSFIEQEMCAKAKAFLGSGESTWSLRVFYKRLATRKAAEVIKSKRQNLYSKGPWIHDIVSEALLSDQHSSGIICRYSSYYNLSKTKFTIETFKDEQPDGWLDLEACEKRIGKGGQCKIAECI
eukprot:Gb_29917 [translate_table: standard]